MMSRLLAYAVLAAAVYWLWTGPIRDMRTVSYDEKLEANADAMSRCLKGKLFAEGATGTPAGDAEAQCAKKLNLYLEDGVWYSYEDRRRSDR